MIARLVPAVVLVAAGLYLLEARKLPLGTMARPGAGFFPVVVAVFGCLVGLVATVLAFAAPRDAGTAAAVDEDAPVARRRVATTTLALFGFCLAMPWIGYPAAAVAFVVAMLSGLGSRWTAAVAIGVLSVAISHYLFAVLLDVPLPRGPW